MQNREEDAAVSRSDNLGGDKGHIFPLQMETFEYFYVISCDGRSYLINHPRRDRERGLLQLIPINKILNNKQ